ncbi:hypothetical protein [Actinoplanes sp. NPDC051494]|uniref:hypothetical protein n=1 Tax=Actinoplanes sp. NPDC051494 TaxID=3363907 RepID=UPI0037875450
MGEPVELPEPRDLWRRGVAACTVATASPGFAPDRTFGTDGRWCTGDGNWHGSSCSG